jgi:hypothetical protein
MCDSADLGSKANESQCTMYKGKRNGAGNPEECEVRVKRVSDLRPIVLQLLTYATCLASTVAYRRANNRQRSQCITAEAEY